MVEKNAPIKKEIIEFLILTHFSTEIGMLIHKLKKGKDKNV